MEIKKGVTINKPVEDLYRYWRRFELLPTFMKDVTSVQTIDPKRSHWVLGKTAEQIEWDVEITEDLINERIAWRSRDGEKTQQAGAVTFNRAPGNRGTEVRIRIEYPGRKPGALLAKFIGESPENKVREDLLRFKQLIETGEIPTIEGQPQGPG